MIRFPMVLDAIIICGTTGESPTLNHEEHVGAIKFAVRTYKQTYSSNCWLW